MSAHTPGPWTLNKDGRKPMIGLDVKDGGALLPIVPEVHGYSVAEAKHNARLIAAAPELLETLRVACEFIQEDRDMLFETVVTSAGETLEDIADADDRAAVERYDALLRVIASDIAKAAAT